MNISDVDMKILNTEVFPQHNIADLNSDKNILLFRSVWRSFYGERK